MPKTTALIDIFCGFDYPVKELSLISGKIPVKRQIRINRKILAYKLKKAARLALNLFEKLDDRLISLIERFSKSQQQFFKNNHALQEKQYHTIGFLLAAAALSGVLAAWFMADSNSPGNDASQYAKPVDISPQTDQDAGVTVLAMQMPEKTVQAEPVYAPLPGSVVKAEGYAMELGSALSFAELSARFAQIVSLNNNIGAFDRLDPRAVLKDTMTGLEAILLVGPFETEADAGTACKAIRKPEGLGCTAVEFDGVLIDRE